MKASRISVVLLAVFGLVCPPAPARAETLPARAENFVAQFLSRYKPAKVALPASPAVATQAQLSDLIRSGELPLSVGDVINLVLQNNLDVGVNRLSPFSSEYVIETM